MFYCGDYCYGYFRWAYNEAISSFKGLTGAGIRLSSASNIPVYDTSTPDPLPPSPYIPN